jgi:hypothetical protein
MARRRSRCVPLRETYEIRTGDLVMVAYLTPRDPEEEVFDILRVGLTLVAETMGFLIVDSRSGGTGGPCMPGGGISGARKDPACVPLLDDAEFFDFVMVNVG